MNRQLSTVFFVSVLMVILTGCAADQTGRFVLTSADGTVNRPMFDIKGDGWRVTKRTLHGGRQEGVELVTVDNGVMQITIIPTRGMSIYEVRSGDMRLGWDSPVEDIVNPTFIDLESRGGLGWLEGFNEWLVRCGLEFAGHPGTDEFINNTGDTATMDLTLHGKVGNIPASEVEVFIDPKPPHRISVRGVVYEKFFYGPKFKLIAEVSVVPGQDTLRIQDSVTNLGAFEQEFQIIYHTNFGPPLLEEGSTVFTAAKSLAPMNEHAGKSIDSFEIYDGPTTGFIEQVFLIEPYSDDDGLTAAVLVNANKDRAASMTWSTRQLPYLTIWKNTVATGSGYVTGIEPATGYPYNRKIERSAGRLPRLMPGETRQFKIDVGLHAGTESVHSAINSIRSIKQNRLTTVVNVPPVPPKPSTEDSSQQD